MSEIKDGGPAFPNIQDGPAYDGMSLRDWFAGQALTGLLLNNTKECPRCGPFTISGPEHAYKIADALLAERERRAAL